jgi:copper homeostasis protein
MKLEICANSYHSAINAQNAGADRIELCSNLTVGGITPSNLLLKKVSKNITIPVHVLIRPRSGDFNYSENELLLMKENIKRCKEYGFNGIVSGILNTNKSIDIERTKELIALSKPLSFTFHRAFDCVSNPKKALKELIALEIDRILTSGLEEKAINGIALLKELKDIAKEQLIILPGSGINATNARTFKSNGFKEIHTSASKIIANSNLDLNSTEQTISDVTTITEILNIIKNT